MQSEPAFLLTLLDHLSPTGEKPGDSDTTSQTFWLIWMRLSYLGLKVTWLKEEKRWATLVNK